MSHLQLILLAGIILGLLYGLLAQRFAYCAAGGLREWWEQGRRRRAAALWVAMATALIGTQVLAQVTPLDLGTSLYLQPSFSWLLVPLGGIIFGYGMIMARGCGSRALVLLGSGNLRSLWVLLALGLSAAITLTGPLAPLRVSLTQHTSISPAAVSLADWGGPWWWTILLSGLFLWLALSRFELKNHPKDMAGATIIGLLIPVGWWITGVLGADDFEPVRVESLTFVAPVSNSIQYLMWSTGLPASFGVLVVAGVLSGSFVMALITRTFAWQGFESAHDMKRLLIGGCLMGVGGALALGCTVGQGLSGWSTLSIASMSAIMGIVLGARVALKGFLRYRGA